MDFSIIAALLFTISISSAEVSVNLCDGGLGCCGSGMHTPGPNGEYLGADGDHEYKIYEPMVDTPENWSYWDLICKTTAPAGKKGKLVTLGSRKELDCLVQFINDEFGEPAFEKFSLGLKASLTRNRGVYSWVDTEPSVLDFDADSPKFTNWYSGVPASGQQCTFMAVGTSIVNGLWYGTDCNVTPMYGICEIEPL